MTQTRAASMVMTFTAFSGKSPVVNTTLGANSVTVVRGPRPVPAMQAAQPADIATDLRTIFARIKGGLPPLQSGTMKLLAVEAAQALQNRSFPSSSWSAKIGAEMTDATD